MNNSIAIFSWIIYRISRIHHHSFKAAATREAKSSQTRDGVGNGDGGQTAAAIVSIISWLSILYALNGRKVTVWILFRNEKVII